MVFLSLPANEGLIVSIFCIVSTTANCNNFHACATATTLTSFRDSFA